MCLDRAVEALGVGLAANSSGVAMGIGVPVARGDDLAAYAHQTVLIAGKVESVQGDLLVLSGVGGVSFKVQKNPGIAVTSPYVLVQAVVVPDAPLRGMNIHQFGDSFDLDGWAELIDTANKTGLKQFFS